MSSSVLLYKRCFLDEHVELYLMFNNIFIFLFLQRRPDGFCNSSIRSKLPYSWWFTALSVEVLHLKLVNRYKEARDHSLVWLRLQGIQIKGFPLNVCFRTTTLTRTTCDYGLLHLLPASQEESNLINNWFHQHWAVSSMWR